MKIIQRILILLLLAALVQVVPVSHLAASEGEMVDESDYVSTSSDVRSTIRSRRAKRGKPPIFKRLAARRDARTVKHTYNKIKDSDAKKAKTAKSD